MRVCRQSVLAESEGGGKAAVKLFGIQRGQDLNHHMTASSRNN